MLYAGETTMKKIPVILDTDIGTDIDDAWAVVMMLKRPEIDVKLITTTTDETDRRCGLVHRLLDAAGRTDIPIAAGKCVARNNPFNEFEIVSRDDAPCPYRDAVEAIRDAVLASSEPVTLIEIGPMCNLAELLDRFPEVAPRVDLVAMAGSISHGHNGDVGQIPEWNVKTDIPSSQKAFSAPWRSVTITPLDTCGMVTLKGNWYEKLKNGGELQKELSMQYLAWLHRWDSDGVRNIRNSDVPQERSSILYDTVAIHLAYSHEFLEMKEMRLFVDDGGFTRESYDGTPINVAIEWLDFDGYSDMLAKTIL